MKIFCIVLLMVTIASNIFANDIQATMVRAVYLDSDGERFTGKYCIEAKLLTGPETYEDKGIFINMKIIGEFPCEDLGPELPFGWYRMLIPYGRGDYVLPADVWGNYIVGYQMGIPRKAMQSLLETWKEKNESR